MTRQPATSRGDGRRSEDRRPTHRVVTSPARQLGTPAGADTTGAAGAAGAATPPPAAGDRPAWRDRLAETFSGLRFVNRSPGSLRDQIDYAEDGAYSTRDGWWRTANIVFAKTVARVGLTVCYFLAWAVFTRLSRCLTTLVVAPCALMLLNGIPLVGYLIPDWADVTTWFAPASDLDVPAPPVVD